VLAFYRRKLPHWHPDLTEESFLFVTWRLAGSLPVQSGIGIGISTGSSIGIVGQALSPANLTAGRAFVALDRVLDKAGFGPVWLKDPRIAQIVADALLYGETGRHYYKLRAWVVMPNHVHVLLRPAVRLAVITRWLKGPRRGRPTCYWAARGSASGRMNPSTIG
jgi:putative DNA methylase